jgi:glutamate 5-kinase
VIPSAVRVVAKIGTSSLTDDLGVIERAAIACCATRSPSSAPLGHEVVVVSSGAVAAGVAALGLPSRPTDMPTLQALSAAGQSRG